MAAILGTVRSFLAAMPFLRAFTDNMLAFVNQHKCHGWDTKLVLPPALQDEVRRIGELMVGWKGQKFLGQVPIRNLHSDSSDWGWGGVDITTGSHVQDYWRDKSGLHINIKELQAEWTL